MTCKCQMSCSTFRCPTFLGFSSNWELKYMKYNKNKQVPAYDPYITLKKKYTGRHLSVFPMSSIYGRPTKIDFPHPNKKFFLYCFFMCSCCVEIQVKVTWKGAFIFNCTEYEKNDFLNWMLWTCQYTAICWAEL